MTAQDIAALRLVNQGIASDATKTVAEVVGRMGAMQAQDYYGSLWAIGLRTHSTEQEVLKSIETFEIVRTWPQRGTLHFVPARDARWLVGLSAERMLRGATTRREGLGITEDVLLRSKAVLSEAIGAGLLSRPKAMEALEAAGISTKAGRGYHILLNLSQTGITFIGPMEGKQQTIGLLGNLPEHIQHDRQAGIAELARRYFTSHGPATLKDFMWWSGLTSKDVKAGLEANNTVLTSETVEGKEYWLPRNLQAEASATDTSYLLPGFDEYMLGYADRSAILHADHAQKVVPGSNGMFMPTIVINGQIVGIWKRTIKKDRVVITLSPFKKLAKTELASLQKPVEDYGHFVGLPTLIS